MKTTNFSKLASRKERQDERGRFESKHMSDSLRSESNESTRNLRSEMARNRQRDERGRFLSTNKK
ncbi:MAG: hypothetical protein LBQ22_11040 [Bacteroidales bacterium]|jgi:hypothetical protein|nr:hypothetical protein [Bacteroidales bacterium]